MDQISKGHVYLVDDNDDMRMYLSNSLRLMGYTLNAYASADEYLEKSKDVSPAVMLLDMRMPKKNGSELQRRMLEIGRKTPIVFISGDADRSEIIEAFIHGAVDFLWKPFSHERLREAIEKGIAIDRSNTEKSSSLERLQKIYHSLSRREQELFILMGDGLTNKAIASLKDIQPGTVKKHRATIYSKIGITKTSDLILLCKGHDLKALANAAP